MSTTAEELREEVRRRYAESARAVTESAGGCGCGSGSCCEGDEVEDVLAAMQLTGAHLARVIDESGEVTGVVFLEDVLEELVGEVTDTTQR